MNEVEKHYAPHDDGEREGAIGRPKAAAEGVSARAKAVLDDASASLSSAREGAGRAYETAAGWAQDQYGDAAERLGQVRRRTGAEFARGRQGVETLVEENPLMLAVAGFAAGLLVGALLPGTRRENRLFGRYADEVKDQGWQYAQGLAEQGKHLVEESLDVSRRTDPPASAARPTYP